MIGEFFILFLTPFSTYYFLIYYPFHKITPCIQSILCKNKKLLKWRFKKCLKVKNEEFYPDSITQIYPSFNMIYRKSIKKEV